mgnify:CR=1 FL=1
MIGVWGVVRQEDPEPRHPFLTQRGHADADDLPGHAGREAGGRGDLLGPEDAALEPLEVVHVLRLVHAEQFPVDERLIAVHEPDLPPAVGELQWQSLRSRLVKGHARCPLEVDKSVADDRDAERQRPTVSFSDHAVGDLDARIETGGSVMRDYEILDNKQAAWMSHTDTRGVIFSSRLAGDDVSRWTVPMSFITDMFRLSLKPKWSSTIG